MSTLSAEQGFRVWIGEGRSLRDVDGHKAGRVELACYRFRNKDEQGKRTRVGGCRFVIKAVQCYEKGVEVDERKWKLVAGTFVCRLLPDQARAHLHRPTTTTAALRWPSRKSRLPALLD